MYFKFNFLLLLLIETFVEVFSSSSYSPSGFFSSSDVTSITWAHAVNTQELLTQVLSDPSIQMIEADVSRGRIQFPNGSVSIVDLPVMAHPPTVLSNLSFASFMNQVIEFNRDKKELSSRKGVKLDFKDYYAAAIAISQLDVRNVSSKGQELQFPIWINADVLQGPVESTSKPKMTPSNLFDLHNRYLKGSVLSLGWTTRFGKQSDGLDITTGKYTREMVDEMIAAIRAYPEDIEDPDYRKNLPITFAVRAGIAAQSIGELAYLLNSTSTRSTLTLWTGANDPQLPPTNTQDVIKVIGRSKTFVDLPYSFKESNAAILSFSFKNLCFIFLSCFLRYIFAHL